MTEAELAWTAGLFEGEATIRINKATGRNLGSLCVMCVNTDRDVIDWFQARWPGYCKPYQPADNRKQAWMWTIAARKAIAFLDAIEPYVVRARVHERIKLAREFQAHKRNSRQVRAEDKYDYAQEDWVFYLRFRELNARGRDAA